jgi:hypothetical protein
VSDWELVNQRHGPSSGRHKTEKGTTAKTDVEEQLELYLSCWKQK